MISQTEITRVLQNLCKSQTHDANGLTSMFNKFLLTEYDYIISFMNYQCFRGQYNLLSFLTTSIENNGQNQSEVRKIIYNFVAQYVTVYKPYISQYLPGLFDKFYGFFKKQTSFRPKAQALSPIKQILLNYTSTQLQGVLDPTTLHKSLTTTLKIQSNIAATVRGELWHIIGIIQSKFASSISYTQKRDVQTTCLRQLQKLVDQNKNVSTIASILRSFSFSLNQNYLDDKSLEDLFVYAKAIMIPLKDTFGASIAALQLISTQSVLFHPFIMKNAVNLFKNLQGLMGHQNKQYKFAVLDTLAVVVKQIVVGINSDIEDPKMRQLFDLIGITMWNMLQQQTKYDPNRAQQKNRFYGSAISIVKILGNLSPLIKTLNGEADLKKFFVKLLNICNRKVIRAFQQTQSTSGAVKKIHVMKIILYNQKQLVSFINSFARILQQLQQIQYKQALSLEQLFLIGVRQYPFFLEKYLPQLVQSMVLFLLSLFQKKHIFSSWCKKIILVSLMESLDAKRFNINTDTEFYLMIKKSSKMWNSILTHSLGSRIAIKQFGRILFECMQHLFLNLDISYKTNIELQMQNEEQQKLKQQELDLVNIFFMSDQNIQMSNIADYQYISSLALVFNQMMLKIQPSLYEERLYGFYDQIIYRIKIFPKSIPLMKVIRSLNTYISRSNWLNQTQENNNSKKIRQLLSVLKNFFIFICDNIFKYQENYFYQALKMLLSMPLKVFLFDDCQVLKNNLPTIIMKALDIGQQIISLAYQTIQCLNCLFKYAKNQSVAYLSSCIPYLQKYINFAKNTVEGQQTFEEKQQIRSYLFLYQCQITRKQVSANVMKFLGSIGGISHMMVQNSTKDYISWDYYCKLDLLVVMGGDSFDINLTKLLSRTCWLMLHGTQVQKIVASQFMHAIMVYVIGRASPVAQGQVILQTKQNLSNFFDRVLPTLLNVSSNSSHPSQQLIHTLVIQTIHFLANTQDPNSPDIQTLLKHLIALYTGAQDLSFLASKCLSQLIKWHLKQSFSQNTSYPLVKTVMRNVWSLISNKKARSGLIQFLIKFLKVIHRNSKLMSVYSLQFCSLIISLGRTNKQIQAPFQYLIRKFILAIGPHMKLLIIEQNSRKFKKLSTIQKMVDWIYNNSLFSVYRQQRYISYIIWQSIIGKYGQLFNSSMKQGDSIYNIQIYFSEQCNRNLKYLFSQSKEILIDEDQPKLQKLLPKITAYGEMWIKIVKNQIFQTSKLQKFKDLQEVYLDSFCSFLQYFNKKFLNLQPKQKILNLQTQKSILQCILIFVQLYLNLQHKSGNMSNYVINHLSKKKIPIFQKVFSSKVKTLVQLLLLLVFKPNSVIPNFNYDIISQSCENILVNSQIQNKNQAQRRQLQKNYYFKSICKFLCSILSNNLIPTLAAFVKSQFKIQRLQELIPAVMQQSSFYDREIRCVVATMSIFAKQVGSDNREFESVLKVALKLTVDQYEQNKKSKRDMIIQHNDNQKQISNEKKSLLIWYILEHAENYSVIRSFLVATIQNDTVIYQKHEKQIMKSIRNNWFGVGQKLLILAKNNHKFLSIIFVLCKMLTQEHKKRYLYELIQKHLMNAGLTARQQQIMSQHKEMNRESVISYMLKICFYVVEDIQNFPLSSQFVDYIHELICQGLDIVYSVNTHEQTMNLVGIIIRQHTDIESKDKYLNFIQKFRRCLTKITNFYIPKKISKLQTPQARNRCSNYLKMFKSMVILSNQISYLQFIFSYLKDDEIENFYYKMLEDIIDQCLSICYDKNSYQKQLQDLRWMFNFYWSPTFDTDCWRNVRVVMVDQILRKALKITKQEVLIRIFQEQTERLINNCLKNSLALYFDSIKQLIFNMELKRSAFSIIEQLYLNLPRKQKNTEQVHKKQYHKQIIKFCNQYLKSKTGQISKNIEQAEILLKQYDKKTAETENQKLNILKEQGKKPKGVPYLRKLFCGAYNCLIVLFISTQSNKIHFQNYLFQSKGLLWKKIVDQQQQDFNFQILTNFEVMKPIQKINKKLNKKIKQKYWQNSLYAIEEEYVPTSLVQNIPQNTLNIETQNNQSKKNEQQKILELDVINKHPCMINLLRVIDFMHEKFYDGSVPGWMQPVHDQLMSDSCALSVRIFLTKLVINRPSIFTQNMWAQVLLKYLQLKQNGGKFIHYYFRDAIKQFLTFFKNGFKIKNTSQLSSILMKVIRALPHQDLRIYSDNIDIMEAMLKIDGIYVYKNVLTNMIKANEKSKPQVNLKFEWRMCATITIKLCLQNGVPAYDQNQSISKNAEISTKYRFYFDLKRDGLLNLIFQMAGQTAKKYRIAAAGFLGEYLNFICQNHYQRTEKQEIIKIVAQFLSNINMQQANRNSKQKFSLCVLHVAKRFPQILNDSRLYNQVESSLSIYCKQQRLQILEAIEAYCHYIIGNNTIGYLPHIFVTIRSIINKLFSDIHQVQSKLVSIMYECCKHQILINKQIIETYYYVYDEFQRVFSNSVHFMDAFTFYKILICLRDFTNDPDLPKSPQVLQLSQKVARSILKGLGSQHQKVKQLIFDQLQRQFKNYSDSAQRMLDILVKIYNPENEELWIINVVPLIFSLIKQSSDYTRLRFEKPLGQITTFYDWDFRKNMRMHNSSQPYTPAFTLSTGANNIYRKPDGTIEYSYNPTIGGDKLRGMIKASQNFYMSQQQQVFTILASQSDYQPSIGSSQTNQVQSSHTEQTESQQNNKLKEIFTNARRRRNKIMQDFKQSNMRKYSSINIVDNKIRFNKNVDKSISTDSMSPSLNQSNKQLNRRMGNKGVLIRKYKVGQLPDIQITTKDIVDPMLYLSNCDHQFASQLFIIIFMKICLYSRRDKKQKFKQVICWLLKSSRRYEYNFISCLQKSLICLCYNQKQKIDFSLKEIAMKSNTLDYAIVFTQQNQIQTLKDCDKQNQAAWQQKCNDIWGDLIDMYQQINQQDLIYGVLVKLATGDQRKLLLQALNLKRQGNIKRSLEFFNNTLQESSNRRLKQFIQKEKIDCNTILGAWEPITIQMTQKMEKNTLSINQQKILSVALQNTQINQKYDFLRKIVFHETKCQYQKAILFILFQKDYDMAYHHLQKSIQYFSTEWKKISSFAFNSKHTLLQQVQKKFELQQFLQFYKNDEIKYNENIELFSTWSSRQPNSIYDSNLTFLQILESRRMYSQILTKKFNISQKILIRSTIDWLIQMSNGMVEKGVLGGAQVLIKKALQCKRKERQFFIWDFYDSVAHLKLKQLQVQKNKVFKQYQIVADLVQKEMNDNHNQITHLEKLKFISLKNELFQGYLSSCLTAQTINSADFVNKIDLIFKNYLKIKNDLKQLNQFMQSQKQSQSYKKDYYFKFALFLEKLLILMSQKTSYIQIKRAMLQKNYQLVRLSQFFLDTLFTSIEISDLTNKFGSFQQNKIFSLIMKLIKIIQTYPETGNDFAEHINNKKVPIWIFLYFIPQMIKFINNHSLVACFEDLFKNISVMYPQALIYHFNCSYQERKDCLTPFCQQLFDQLRKKMDINLKFIESLVLLQYPEIRLKQAIVRLMSIPYQRDNAINDLRNIVKDGQLVGKYNKKFIEDWQPKVMRVLNKIQANDSSVLNDLKLMLSHIDPLRKQNLKTVAFRMKQFAKISDGSTFFQDYNSNDWNRIQIPGTSYRKFEQPKPWKRIFIQSFDYSLMTLNSKQRPRRITVFGSNQKKYMMLIKGGQDVRLDQRIQQLFQIMNRVLRCDSQCSKKQLQIKRFQVTPIKKMMGIFQWIDQSQTLKQFFQTQFKIIKQNDKVNFRESNKAFEIRMEFLNKICPPVPGKDSNMHHKAILNATKQDVVKCFIQCQRQIPYGLLRRALQRLSKNYDSFLHIKNTFIANYALICSVTYILGIGDRHLQNFLIHMASASLVPIDFGYSFGSGVDLFVPELIPFRLTKTFVQLMDPIGFDGLFKKSMIASFEVFAKNVALISDYCQVFVDDPLLQWIWTHKKNASSQVNRNVQFSNSQQAPQKAMFTEKVIIVRKKLEGQNPRMLYETMITNSRHKHENYAKNIKNAIWGQSKLKQKNLSTPDVIDQLISLATDKNVLGRTYLGWNPYV